MATRNWYDEEDQNPYDVFGSNSAVSVLGTTSGQAPQTDRQAGQNTYTPYGVQAATNTQPSAATAPATGLDRNVISGAYESYLGRPMTEADYSAHAQNPYGTQGVVDTVKSSREAQGYSSVNAYQQKLAALSSTTDPRQKAILQDQLGRDIFTELKNAGHDVKWDGPNLIVDGRAYEIGGGQAATQNAAGQDTTGWDTDTYAAPGYTVARSGAAPAGWEQSNWDNPNMQTPKYAIGAILNKYPPTVNGLKAAMAEIQQAYPGTEAVSFDKINVPGVGLIDVGGAFDPNNPDAEGKWWWGDQSQAGTTYGGNSALDAATAPGAPGAAAVGVNQGVAAGGSSVTPGATTAAPAATFQTTGQTYTPGTIGTEDIPTFTAAQLLEQAGTYTPTPLTDQGFETYDFNGWQNLPGLDVGTIDDETEALVSRILSNPESLDARTIEMLKGASREEQAALAKQQEEELTNLGYANGIADSRWLASEQLGTKTARDNAIIGKNRDIDIDAAKTNAGDRLAAANLGSAYTTAKANRLLAERGQLFGEQQAGEGLKLEGVKTKQAKAQYLTGLQQSNNDNLFKAADLRTRQVMDAAKLDLDRSAQMGDRMALRESINQKAAELGLRADELQLDYTLALIADATDRYGIDIGATIDREKLAQAGREFQEDLAFRFAQLAQQGQIAYAQLGEQGRQFNLGYGLDAANLQRGLANDQWDRYKWLYGGA